MKRSNLGGFLVNPSPTYVTFVTIRFHAFPVTHQTDMQTESYSLSSHSDNYVMKNSGQMNLSTVGLVGLFGQSILNLIRPKNS